MHELSIAMSILEIAEEEAERHGNAHVQAVHLRLGPLSGVVKEALVSAFQLASEETALSNCSLVIEDVPISAFCATCNAERRVRSMQCFSCVECGMPASDVIHGHELQVSALELAE